LAIGLTFNLLQGIILLSTLIYHGYYLGGLMDAPVITISDSDTKCPVCGGTFGTIHRDDQIVKICTGNHEFVVKNPVIYPEKEKK
jgi:hypothetical protein